MIEVGIPFSDPVADGPVIQAAAERALAAGRDDRRLLRPARATSARAHPDVPVGILTYANIVARARPRRLLRAPRPRPGSTACWSPTCPCSRPSRSPRRRARRGIAPVLIAAPNTPRETLRGIAELGGGYTYCVARAGVTGAGDAIALDHDELFATLAASARRRRCSASASPSPRMSAPRSTRARRA